MRIDARSCDPPRFAVARQGRPETQGALDSVDSGNIEAACSLHARRYPV